MSRSGTVLELSLTKPTNPVKTPKIVRLGNKVKFLMSRMRFCLKKFASARAL